MCNKWISIGDRLPEDKTLCFTLSVDEPNVSIFSNSKFWFNDVDLRKYQVQNVTHWQPLPDPPEEK